MSYNCFRNELFSESFFFLNMLRLSALHCSSAKEILETDFGVVDIANKWILSFLSCRSQL